jgi:hypothetical protein
LVVKQSVEIVDLAFKSFAARSILGLTQLRQRVEFLLHRLRIGLCCVELLHKFNLLLRQVLFSCGLGPQFVV